MNTIKPNRQTPPKKKLPYEKPGVVSDHVFETLALSCHSVNPIFCDPNGDTNPQS